MPLDLYALYFVHCDNGATQKDGCLHNKIYTVNECMCVYAN